MFTYEAGSLRRLAQPVRNRTQLPAGICPCLASQACRNSGVRMKSSFWLTSSVASTTTAEAMKLAGSMVSTELLGTSLPETQCTGASKWVPVCSPQVKLFQYQAGPASLYWEMVSILNDRSEERRVGKECRC